jgi:hypothetical protein
VIERTGGGVPEVYDLASDPQELSPIQGPQANEVRERLGAAYHAWRSDPRMFPESGQEGRRAADDAEIAARLEALGYL